MKHQIKINITGHGNTEDIVNQLHYLIHELNRMDRKNEEELTYEDKDIEAEAYKIPEPNFVRMVCSNSLQPTQK